MGLEVVKPSPGSLMIFRPSHAGVLVFLSVSWRFLIVTFICSCFAFRFYEIPKCIRDACVSVHTPFNTQTGLSLFYLW